MKLQHSENAALFQQVCELVDAANARDPRREVFQGAEHPVELLYGRRMSGWLDKLEPDASLALKIACRAQHIRRWEVPRETYPMTREGYLEWRKFLYGFHGDIAAGIMREAGIDDATIERVRFLLQKKKLKTDPETQTLEDAACLVFLENHLLDFSRHLADEAKLINILQRTWAKMSAHGRQVALQMDLPDRSQNILRKALC